MASACTSHYFILFLVLSGHVHGMFNRESPVLWRRIDDPVITDVIEVIQDVLYVNPCYVLNNSTVDPESLDFVSDWCQDLWTKDFVNSVKDFCPAMDLTPDHTLHIMRDPVQVRHKRMPFVLPFAIPALSLVKTAVMAVVTLFSVAFGAYSLSEHSDSRDFREKALKEMEQRRQEHERIGALMNKFAAEQLAMNIRLDKLERRVDTFIRSYPLSSTLIAGLAAKMAHLKPELQRIASLWKNDKVDPSLFSLFEIPLDPNADVTRAMPLSCNIDEHKRIISFKFRLPIRDPHSYLMKADPFILYTYPGNESLSCSYEYDGPKYSIYNDVNKCVSPLFGTKSLEDHFVYLPASNSCSPITDTGFSKFYKSTGCKNDKNLFSVSHSVQLKFTKEANFCYCYGTDITYDSHFTRPCPDYAFKFPPTTNFSTGNQHYYYRTAHWQKEAKFFAEPNHRINTILMPDLDLITSDSDIWKLHDDIIDARHGPVADQKYHSVFSVSMILFGFTLFAILLCICYLKYRSFQSTALTSGLMREMEQLRPQVLHP
jgi:hypothetical protein